MGNRFQQQAGRALAGLVPAGVRARWNALDPREARLLRYLLPFGLLYALAIAWAVYDRLSELAPGRVDLPDFTAIEQTAERKQAFIEFLEPIVEHENEHVLEQREQLLEILDELESGDSVSGLEQAWLAGQASAYRVQAKGDLARARKLRARIDTVPVSLAIAQAALESAWGTSRFARQGNNLFGQWCSTPGCGIVPKKRPEGASYEVQAFDTVRAAVRTYIHKLNSHPAYAPVRQIRAEARAAGRDPTGTGLAAGLVNYAAIGEAYVERVRTVIRRNDLQDLDS